MDAGSPAQTDGRAHRAPMPPEYHWIVLTHGINALLQTAYSIEQVRAMDAVQLNLLETFLLVRANPSLADEVWEPQAPTVPGLRAAETGPQAQ